MLLAIIIAILVNIVAIAVAIAFKSINDDVDFGFERTTYATISNNVSYVPLIFCFYDFSSRL